MQNESGTNQIFVSYSRSNVVFVTRVVEHFKSQGIDPWFDNDDIPKTAEWWVEIQKGILGANAFIFVISPASLQSEVCNWELAYAIVQNKKIIPLLHMDVFKDKSILESVDKLQFESPEGKKIIARANWLYLRRINFIFIEKDEQFDKGLAEVLASYTTDLKHVEEHTRLLQRSLDWENGGKNRSYLLTGLEIRRAETWLKEGLNKEPRPTQVHLEYITTSRAAQRRTLRKLLIGVSVALIITIVLALLSFGLYRQSETNLRVAWDSQSLFLADLSRQELNRGQPQSALLLALESLTNYDKIFNPESKTALVNALNAPVEEMLTLKHVTTMSNINENIEGAAWSPDEKRILSWSNERMWLWTSDGKPIASLYGAQSIFGASWNKDGSKILSWGVDVQLWDGHDGRLIHTYGGDKYAQGALLTSDNHRLLSWSSDGTVGVWSVETGNKLLTLKHNDEVTGAVWSKDNRRILSWSQDDQAVIWDAKNGAKLFAMPHIGAVAGAKWNATESQVVTWSKATDHSKPLVTIWDVSKKEPLLSLEHTSDLTYATWNKAETRMLTVALDTVYLWDTFSGEQLESFPHDQWVYDAAWNQQETKILTRAGNSAWIWSVNGELLWQLTQGDKVAGARWNADFSRVLTWSADNTIRIWNANTGEQTAVMAHDTGVGGAMWSGDEKSVLSWAGDEIKVWGLNPSYQHVDESLSVPTLIQDGYERIKRPLSNEERTRFFLSTLVPTPTNVPQLLQSNEPFQIGLSGFEVFTEENLPEVGIQSPPYLPIYVIPLETSLIATQVSAPNAPGFKVNPFGAIQLDLSGLNNTVVIKSLPGLYADFVMHANIIWGPGNDANGCGIIFREVNSQNYYAVSISKQFGALEIYSLINGERVGTKRGIAGQIKIQKEANAINEMLVIVEGNAFSIFINGELAERFENDTFASGQIGLIADTPNKSDIAFCTFTDVKVSTSASAPAIIATPHANTSSRGKIVTDGRIASVRIQPDGTSSVITGLQPDTLVEILDEQGNWYQIQLDDGRTGWVAKTLVQKQ